MWEDELERESVSKLFKLPERVRESVAVFSGLCVWARNINGLGLPFLLEAAWEAEGRARKGGSWEEAGGGMRYDRRRRGPCCDCWVEEALDRKAGPGVAISKDGDGLKITAAKQSSSIK